MCTVAPQNKPHCTCQHGYVRDPEYGCVDEHPPLLNLRPDPIHGTDPKTGITHLSQGGRYEEYGVDVTDDNAEEYLRSLKITYSRPLPQGCLLDMGEFYVNYTVATPWTTPDFVRAKRTVVIDNVNECLIKEDNMGVGGACPELVAMCDVSIHYFTLRISNSIIASLFARFALLILTADGRTHNFLPCVFTSYRWMQGQRAKI